MDVEKTVLSFFKSKKNAPDCSDEELLKYNYINAELLDSVGIVEMITDFEETFVIRFSQDDFQSEIFQTIDGLISIIERLRER
jgi:acyl carrier protein